MQPDNNHWCNNLHRQDSYCLLEYRILPENFSPGQRTYHCPPHMCVFHCIGLPVKDFWWVYPQKLFHPFWHRRTSFHLRQSPGQKRSHKSSTVLYHRQFWNPVPKLHTTAHSYSLLFSLHPSHNNPSQTGRPQRNCSTLKYNRNHHKRFPLRQKAPYGFLTARS